MLKTGQADELIQAVRNVYEGKSALDPVIARKLMSIIFKGPEKKIVEPLTDRELDVLRLAAKGFTNKAIGVQLTTVIEPCRGILRTSSPNCKPTAAPKRSCAGWRRGCAHNLR